MLSPDEAHERLTKLGRGVMDDPEPERSLFWCYNWKGELCLYVWPGLIPTVYPEFKRKPGANLGDFFEVLKPNFTRGLVNKANGREMFWSGLDQAWMVREESGDVVFEDPDPVRCLRYFLEPPGQQTAERESQNA